MPQSPNHPPYWHTLPRRHGDMVRPDGGSAANDLITMGTHVGTHIDALSHVSQDGRLHDGSDAAEASRGGRFIQLGVHTIAPMVCRGVLLDVPAALGTPEGCPAGYEITPADLEAAEARQQTTVGAGDVVLVRRGGGGSSTTLTRVSTLVETAVCREWGRRARGGSPTAGYGRRGRTRSPSSVSHQVRDIVCCPPTESYW